MSGEASRIPAGTGWRGAARTRAGRLRAGRLRLRRPTRLDKVRWLIVYSTDLISLVALTGLLELYVRWERGQMGALPAIAVGLLLVVLFVLAARSLRLAVRGGDRPTALLWVSGVVALVLSAFLVIWAPVLWLGMLLPYARRRVVVAAAVASVVAFNAYLALLEAEVLWAVVALQTGITVFVLGCVGANLWLWRLAKEAHEGQEARALLAVSEERLRFARDLNDLLGQSLSGISAGAARAEELLASDPEAAARRMYEVRDAARQALREVRATVQSYRRLDLDEVLASVRAVLEAAGVRCAVDADTAALGPETRTLLATVVREGATNVLKHSKAERCTITIKDGVLEMSNDGVSGPVGEHAPDGLGGLSRRVSAAGGTLQAAPTREGAYVLRAAVPA
ncbi:sensor histidine kinase [Nonomuraea roseoviolacea]|uniref:Two-component system sensor histidine kinase DesK n=1 Tax=Nonomuraea roseoviolacea subsp. carminata TaxID=160689 RepID=A0ABT1K918_9ACTN|nr:histidine kinase [Nonomuraea roseoviolacea]MCP2349881.1 two-component system sensor histidine kinase DesK [Nonomuraea roseoviolacea subsp. carminata]